MLVSKMATIDYFWAVNLTTIEPNLIASELFGHERGAFTGAVGAKIGRLEFANGGTVLLDEIGEMSPTIQARLLEVLQSKMITPVGSNRSKKLDIRIIAATNRNLPEMVKKGEFREDLYHRLNVLRVDLPRLIDRCEEFDSILHQIVLETSARLGRSVKRIEPEVARVFESYDWPGNIRELQNVIEYSLLKSLNESIALDDLPENFKFMSSKQEFHMPVENFASPTRRLHDYFENLVEFERVYLVALLKHSRNQMTVASKVSGLSRVTLWRRLSSHGIKIERAISGI